MSFLDKAKGAATSLRKQASRQVDKHGDKIAGGIDKAGNTVKKKAPKYSDKVDKATGKAKSGLDKLDGKNDDIPDDRPPSST